MPVLRHGKQYCTIGALRLITWNVAGRRQRLVEQATVIAKRKPDVVALQEVTRTTRPLWDRAFELMGLGHVYASSPDGRASARRTVVMIAARVELGEVTAPLAVPRPESALGVVAQSTSGPLEIHCVHVPNAANGWVKVETLQALRRGSHVPLRRAGAARLPISPRVARARPQRPFRARN